MRMIPRSGCLTRQTHRPDRQRGQRRPHLDYVRDDRPWGSSPPPSAAYFFSVDGKGEHPQRHLAGFSGILQADAYSGFKALYAPDASGKPRIREAACWAHLRRDFFDVHTATKSEIAREAPDRIGSVIFMTSSARSTASPAMPGVPSVGPKPARTWKPSRSGPRSS